MVDLAIRLDPELRESVRIALAAGKIIQTIRQDGLEAMRKADKSVVTRADLEADAFICRELDKCFPGDALLSEEEGYQAGDSGRTWIIDPLDGTQGFLEGGADYAVHIGLVVDGSPLIGVVHEPETGRLYQALATVGTFLSFGKGGTMRQLRVKGGDLETTRLITSWRLKEDERRNLADAAGVVDGGTAHSVGIKVGKLVRREAEAYYSVHPVNLWDICAPQVVLEAAGGRVTDLSGAPIAYTPEAADTRIVGPFLASNGGHHDALCENIRSFQASQD